MKTALWAGLAFLLAACAGSASDPLTPEHEMAEAPQESRAEPAVGVDEEEEEEEGAGDATGASENEPAAASDGAREPPGSGAKETRTAEVIRSVVLRHRDEVRACFDALSESEKGRGGTMTISFTISPRGDVRDAKLSEKRSTIKVAKLTTCAVGVIEKIKFPASSRGFESNANYPFNFKP